MKGKKICTLSLAVIFIMMFPMSAYANSSWHWLTKTIPFDILPYVVVLTLFIEFIVIKKVNSIEYIIRLFLIICLANLASFLLPYAILLIPSAVGYTFEMSIRHMPKYIVGLGYLALTLIAELPIVYFSLKNTVANKRKLLISIIAVNALTTIMVAIIERIVCKGSW